MHAQFGGISIDRDVQAQKKYVCVFDGEKLCIQHTVLERKE